MRSMSYMWYEFSHSPAMPLLAAVGLIFLAMWMSAHPDNRDYNNALDGPSLDRWLVEDAGMGGRRLGFARRITRPERDDYSYGREGVEIKVRPYWAYRIWPRQWRWMQITYPYIGRELGRRDANGEWLGIPNDVSATVTFAHSGRALGPIQLRQPYENDASTANASDIRRVESFLADANGQPVAIRVEFWRAGEAVLTRDIAAPPFGDSNSVSSASLIEALNGGWGVSVVLPAAG